MFDVNHSHIRFRRTVNDVSKVLAHKTITATTMVEFLGL